MPKSFLRTNGRTTQQRRSYGRLQHASFEAEEETTSTMPAQAPKNGARASSNQAQQRHRKRGPGHGGFDVKAGKVVRGLGS